MVGNFFEKLISFLNPIDDNFIGNHIVNGISNILQFLFIPNDETIDNFVASISHKFNFINTIKLYITDLQNLLSFENGLPKLQINFSESKYMQSGTYTILDFSWYAPYKKYGDLIITGFVYITFLWRLFIKLPSTISGVGGDITFIGSEISSRRND